MANDTNDPNALIFNTAKGGLFGGPFDSSSLDPDVRAVMMDFRWTTSFGGSEPATKISYFFPTSTADYTADTGYPSPKLLDTFSALTIPQKNAVTTGLNLIASYTDLTFVQAASGLASDATLRFSQYRLPPPDDNTSEARFPPNKGPYQPTDSGEAGDTFLGLNANAPVNFFGTDDFNTIIHEMGHDFGLKHGHDPNYNGALAPQYNDNEFSVMTYASYLGADTSKATVAIPGSSPQSFMMFDIAALQAYYGANFDELGTTAVYTWNSTTGQENINGAPAPDTGVTATNKIFATVWTEGATTTYDLSNFVGNQVDDLRPGGWLTFSQLQLADLNRDEPPGTLKFQAQGNIYNALLYHGDTNSEISTLIAGNGNNEIIGNDVNDTLKGGTGHDTIFAGSGDDIITGGPGSDSIYFHFGNGALSSGHSILRDTVADLNGDQISGFGSGYTSALDVLGVQFGQISLVISNDKQFATFSSNGSTAQLDGQFTNGQFMIDTRGSGDQQHTIVSYVQHMPTLTEGQAVNPSMVNGVANQPFLTGDGSVQFTLTFDQSVSYYDNSLGYFEVAADGTINNVHMLFSSTHDVAPGQTVDLGVPDNNERIGFFLIQNGFNKYGNLPNDLYLLSPTTELSANVNSSAAPVLLSASQGPLTAAQIFYSFDGLNPGRAPQVASGVAPGSHDLQIGFEDTPNGKGDNDLNDVVISIHASHGYLLA